MQIKLRRRQMQPLKEPFDARSLADLSLASGVASIAGEKSRPLGGEPPYVGIGRRSVSTNGE
jgi:hypothetical protein